MKLINKENNQVMELEDDVVTTTAEMQNMTEQEPKEGLLAKTKRNAKKIGKIALGVGALIGVGIVGSKIGEAKGFDKAVNTLADAADDCRRREEEDSDDGDKSDSVEDYNGPQDYTEA